MSRLTLAIALLAVAGCASGPVWQRPGATEAEVARDYWQCQQTVVPFTKISPTTGRSARTRTNRDERAACMRARGYQLVLPPRGHLAPVGRRMLRIPSPAGVTVSYDRYGSGPPLVLVHGGFSDHRTNWELVKPLFEKQFTVYAVARRGRGETDATEGHRLEDEGRDVAAVIESAGEPVFLLGHSYGAQTALAAAARVPDRVRKLVLYEPPRPGAVAEGRPGAARGPGRAGDWDGLAVTFFRDTLSVPAGELDALRATELWPPIVADARASLGDVRALTRYDFQAGALPGPPGPRAPPDRHREPARPLRHRRPRRRPPGRAHRGVAGPGARRNDHGARRCTRRR